MFESVYSSVVSKGKIRRIILGLGIVRFTFYWCCFSLCYQLCLVTLSFRVLSLFLGADIVCWRHHFLQVAHPSISAVSDSPGVTTFADCYNKLQVLTFSPGTTIATTFFWYDTIFPEATTVSRCYTSIYNLLLVLAPSPDMSRCCCCFWRMSKYNSFVCLCLLIITVDYCNIYCNIAYRTGRSAGQLTMTVLKS